MIAAEDLARLTFEQAALHEGENTWRPWCEKHGIDPAGFEEFVGALELRLKEHTDEPSDPALPDDPIWIVIAWAFSIGFEAATQYGRRG